MKRLIRIGLLIGALAMPLSFAAEPITVKVNNNTVNFPDAQPYVDDSNDRTMVPVRFVSEKLGAQVTWNAQKQTVIMQQGSKIISLKIGEKKALVAGKTITFDAKAVLKDNRTFVPLRFVSESFGAKVQWIEKERLVLITTGNGSGTVPPNGTGTTPTTPNPTTPTTSGGTTNPNTGGVVPPAPIRPGQAANVEAMKGMVPNLKVENGVLKGVIAKDAVGYVLVQFTDESTNESVSTEFLKPNTPFSLKLNGKKGLLTLQGQNGTSFGTVAIDYPSMKIIAAK